MKIQLLLGLAATALLSAGTAGASTLWLNNAGGTDIVDGFDTTTGALLHQYNVSNGNGRGVVTVGNILYTTQNGDGNIYKTDKNTGASLGSINTGLRSLATIAYDGKNFWLGDYSGSNNAYHFDLTSNMVDQTIQLSQCAGNCDGLEYFVRNNIGYLISNRYDGGYGGANIYDIYDLNGNLVTAAFITGHDAGGNTGIAFDGTNFYVDNVYSSSADVFDGTTGAYLSTLTFSTATTGEDLSFDYVQVLHIPEPAAFALFGMGIAGLALARRRAR
jgi:DNA-binding beta-propeller fold protein YncE